MESWDELMLVLEPGSFLWGNVWATLGIGLATKSTKNRKAFNRMQRRSRRDNLELPFIPAGRTITEMIWKPQLSSSNEEAARHASAAFFSNCFPECYCPAAGSGLIRLSHVA
jgi:hypothetical protein